MVRYFVLGAFIVFSILLVRYLDRVPPRHYCDFRVYYKAGKDLIAGKNLYYRETEEVTPYKYSPFFAFVFSPLSLLPIKAAASVFFAINFLCAIGFVYLTYQLVSESLGNLDFSSRQRILVYLIPVVALLRYFFLVWDSGQVNILMCFLVVAGLLQAGKGRDILAGCLFAAAILIKYTPVIFFLYLVVHRKLRVVVWSIVFIGILSMFPALVVGVQKNMFYLMEWIPSIMSNSLDHFSYLVSQNQSIFSMFIRFLSPTYYNIQRLNLSFEEALSIGRWAALVVYLVIFIPGKFRERDRIIDFAALMLCMSLFNPNGWLLNFVSLLMAYMVLIQYLVSIKWKDLVLISLLAFAFVIMNATSREFVGRVIEDWGRMYSFSTIGALVVYIALLKLKFLPLKTAHINGICGDCQ